jgi:hypothetical protein
MHDTVPAQLLYNSVRLDNNCNRTPPHYAHYSVLTPTLFPIFRSQVINNLNSLAVKQRYIQTRQVADRVRYPTRSALHW